MRAWLQVGLLAAVSGALAVCGFGQSVAEAARQQQQQQQPSKPKAERVYTNEDFPSRPADTTQPTAQPPAAKPDAAKPDDRARPDRPSPEELQDQVRVQKQKIRGLEARLTALQRQLDQFTSMSGVTYDGMTFFTSSSASAYCSGVNAMYYPSAADRLYCLEPFLLTAEMERRRGELAEAQGTLEMLQEQLRKMGYRSNYYDPD